MSDLLDKLREYEQIMRVIQCFDAGGRITGVTVSTSPNVMPALFGNISTIDMDYPPQMIDAIKAVLQERRKKLADELVEIGVTGL